ncbi:TonB-dependent receptor [Lacinutrix sp. 5H-3-7-4]|uniref:TonB-dependent receptor n=1 Tax=Lacinutrix sp. (strain 5H-3-7-4) TaxID=983544 RepID=UPI00020A3DD5|nr:TonB-dependent receptor [Lacinutrix sp. 5H-3-7-4]AEH00592.1 TonB-dependent receptor [Lacinutrix sp. 5H-3-7-4]
MKKITKILSLILLFATSISFAQTGKVAGKVIDGEFNDVLSFANILVKGTTTGTTSDFDGNYQLELDAGTYTLVFSFVGYQTTEISDVVITADGVTDLTVTLNASENALDEVVITTTAKRNTESALLNIQKKSVVMLDGLSAQSIKKTGAGDIAAAVKSVPGVSVQGGKYVYVRGLGDRYTKSILNGVDIPGLDPDRNTIPMDIFPTNIIDNVIVLKSASAEYPADFTGGIVNIVTKDFPTKAEYSLSVGASYNPDMHFKDNYLSYEGSNTDFLGYDNGLRNRKINRYQPIPGTFENKQLLTSLTKRFNSQLGADTETSNPNYNFGFTLGNQYDVGETNRIGYQASFSYKNNTKFYEDREDGAYIRNRFDTSVNELGINRTVKGSSGINEVLMNTLLGLTFKTENSKYKLTGLHIQNGESTAGKYDLVISEDNAGGGLLNATGDELTYTQRSITNLSLAGEHTLDSNSGWKMDWVFSPSFSSVQDKDHRATALRIVDVGDDIQYQIDPSSVGNPTRIWRNLSEESWVANAKLEKKYELFNRPAQLKFGGGYTFKYRDFNSDQYLFETTSPNVLNGDVNTILAEENIWTPATGTGTYLDPNNIFQPENSYEGEYNVASMFISNEFNATEAFKIILGLRTEQFSLFYTGVVNEENVTGIKTIDEFDFFPSGNLIYALTEQSNLRASYSRTTARPSFKEASTAQIFDPITNRFFIGGLNNNTFDSVRPTYINNFDVRYEWFREKGQMIAFSGFYKSFTDPIELTFFPQAPKQLTVANLGDATVIGGEVEFRQNLGFISNGFEKFKFNANVSIISSKLQMTDQEFNRRVANARDGETIDDTRDLQGQSPYLINAGLDYNDDDKGFRAGLFYNVQGSTLEVVGTGDIPDVYTQPFNSLNFTLNKTFGKDNKSAIDLKVNNILGDKRESFYESFGAEDQIFSSRNPGTEISLGYSYKF